jgi:hypothetical protein
MALAVHPTSRLIGKAPRIAEMLLAGSRNPAAVGAGAGLGALLHDDPGQGAVGGALDMLMGLPAATALGVGDTQASTLGNAAKKVGVPVFSALQRAFAKAPKQLENASGAQWVQWLQKNAPQLGVRKLELETSGVIPYLQGKGQEKVTRGALEQYADQALPGVERKVLADREVAERAAGTRVEGDSKFRKYQIPGGTDYRETLLTLPRKEPTQNSVATELFGKEMRFLSEDEKQAVVDRLRTLGDREQDFLSSHWDDPNVLAHYRSNVRQDAQGNPVTHIEELQSDWAQKGRKEGFADPTAQSKMDKLNADYAALNDERNKLLVAARDTKDDGEYFRSLVDRADEIAKQLDQMKDQSNTLYDLTKRSIPTAPFVTDTKDWTRLAFRNALEDAINAGHNKVTWTPGATQAERYDLSKQVESVYHSKNSDGTYQVSVMDKNGSVPWESFKATPKELEDAIGKDLTKKIVAGEGADDSGLKVLSGLDLKVGGEGMKGYYDKIVPQTVEEYLRNAGVPGKVKPIEVEIGHTRDADGIPSMRPRRAAQPGIELTPEQIRHIKEKGLPYYSAAPVGAAPLIQDREEFRRGGLVQMRNQKCR